MTAKHWLDPNVEVQGDDGVPLPMRGAICFVGSTLRDDPDNDRTLVDPVPVVTTSDATPVYVTLATLTAGAVVQVDVIVKIRKADGTVRQSVKLSALYYGAAGPAATRDGSLDTTLKGTGAAAATLDTSAAKVRLKLTGIAATDLVFIYEAHVF